MGVLQRGVRGVIARRAAVALALVASCGGAPDDDARAVARRYLADPAYRREELVASLTTRDNDYARLRLARYDSGDALDWSRLPEWNPAVEPARDSTAGEALTPLPIDGAARGGDLVALRALGERAFWRYPAMLAAPGAEPLLRARDSAARYGVRLATAGATGGDLVRVALADGREGLAFTCAACHSATREDGGVVAGLTNARLDLGSLGADADPTLDPAVARRLRAWGPGRVDVTTGDGREPVAIPDLRPVRFQSYLQRAGAVRVRSLASLAVRVETLLITSHHEAVRPPREVALGLAVYLGSLGDALAARNPPAGRGAEVFASSCARCHAPPTYAGGLVAAGVVGTDPSLANSAARGTGAYRVPSLRGVGERERLMHDGSVAGLDALLDAGAHPPGVALSEGDRVALRDFLEGL